MNLRLPVCLPRFLVCVVALMSLAAVFTSCNVATSDTAGILYLGWDTAGDVQLFGRSPDGQTTTQLTGNDPATKGNVATYSLSPNGQAVAYVLARPDGSSMVRLLDPDARADKLLLDCPAAECGELVWAPDNRRLIYERRELDGDTAGSPRLWWLDSTNGETVPLIEGESGPAYGASFSPDGQRLAYVSSKDEGLVVVNLFDGSQKLVLSDTGTKPIWLDDSASLVFNRSALVTTHEEDDTDYDTSGHEFETAVHLYEQQLAADSEAQRLSPDAPVDDGTPTLSPDGEWLAFGRRLSATFAGRQIWIMRPDGSEARQLTDDTIVNHGPAGWSPDGSRLLYQRYATSELESRPSIWVMDVVTGEQHRIVEAGFLPTWRTGGE